ncbi:MAG: DUF4111 domain-containing protein [Anaerolineales bacterium]|jgi:predicted nucleotidyltransferase
MVNPAPTPYPAVNEILQILLKESQEVLGKQFIGMYLYGSLSSGDFHPDASDIDFLVVTEDSLSDETVTMLETMHQHIWDTGPKWADKLEGSYIPKAHLRRYEKSDIPYPTVNEHKFYIAPHGSDWIIQRHIIREQGVTLAGPDPKTLIHPVSPDDIRHAVIGALQEWWFPMLNDPSWLKDHDSPYHAYTILTMCRSLYALEHGTIVSKPIAAGWAQTELGGKWSQVIEQSLATRIGAREFDLYKNALELIRFTMGKVSSVAKQQ